MVFLNYIKLLFMLISMINIHKNQKWNCYILFLFVFEEKTMMFVMSVMTPSITYFSIMRMQSKVKEL